MKNKEHQKPELHHCLSSTCFHNCGQNQLRKKGDHALLDLQAGKEYLIPFPPAQCCFLEFAIYPALFSQHTNIDNIELGGGGGEE